MSDKNKQIAKEVIAEIGGSENVDQAWHCITRLRFNLNSKDKVNVDQIKNINGVLGAQFSGDQFQVIIGNSVSDVFGEVEALLSNHSNDQPTKKDKQGFISSIMDFISGIFTPILPALAGAGLLKGFIALFVTLGWLSNESDTYLILDAIADSVFHFLPFFLAVSAARKLKTNEFIALAIAGTLLYPTFINAFTDGTVDSFDLFGLGIIHIPVTNYVSSVIPILLSVIMLKYVYQFVKKIIPSAIQLMFAPMIALLVVIPITLWLIGPLGNNIGIGLAGIFGWLFDHIGVLAGLLLAGFMPIIIMTGMHYAFVPISLQNLSQYGFDNFLMPMMFISNLGQSGAAFGVAVRTKDKQMRQLAISAGISASIGITEPAMYGVNMKYKKPFIFALISSGILGAFAGWYGFKAFTMGGLPGLFAIPTFADPSGAAGNLIVAISLAVLSVLLPFLAVVITGIKDVNHPSEKNETNSAHSKIIQSEIESGKHIDVQSPLNGNVIPLRDVSDPTFSQGIMGKGIAIEPTENRVVSPISGTVVVMPESQHAIGLKGEYGEEILIHVGIDTVSLQGKHFKGLVKAGDVVKVGQRLIEFDRELIRKEGLQTVTMIIITNSNDYSEVNPLNESGVIFEGESLLMLRK
ncbi:beta-glucoside-specific PTS transporter subunit IIABC [Alkalihalobacillus trypoxylicola]|uniref:PTS beta-glucoside transporter subunit EIIBCA n=1 Tax=Alkalihalobacillus trypoxylicola TaxID=519424 RepID=A0A161QID0_9BACI|nr:beta-glucoside-specific PTS transporter subunit IIABC [Alkalihalobacillus trypoxylicola]KYG29248.1 hypothetical protein AZF04_06905 [Alkalihalobacillus trypoxylicola]